MQTLLSVIIIIASVVIIAIVAQMESEQAGLGTLQGEETAMWGSHKGSSKKDIQNRIVMITSIVFAIALIILVAI
ncbi:MULTISPECIES: preprotein translocase subunit SecG [Peptoniphilus]|uniref:preprotein translocase subunit SecG n=1 Tax=Peptoniphilus TaxID=162289 RepID=UPI000288AF1E|nr:MULTISPECIES: preprotein translocase subunit SecG [Peptoniphilus]MBS6611201.1 preprotein translocase subunit SecG [Peptoniphilus harei]MDU1042980.1 preprotein translocase subunit SecG [Peptoniphilus rhinitidis]MDU1954426.1 preprotein translocase subunit SecG [Peptoniphilus lacydonensis]MDU2109502.1 preprotein translocase subunit SecG [Peptoniphilus lacydonensis]MDU2115155.1 preprotein translocase subunit SecG [Peptoniphilus lacydonensis]